MRERVQQAVDTFRVTIEDGTTVRCAADRAVAQELKRCGVTAIMLGCRGGGCGVCRIKVLSGSYVTRVMSREHVSVADERAGYALCCCLYPRSDLVLRAAPRLD